MEQCEECGSMFEEPIKRDCYDICDDCYDKLTKLTKHLSDRDNRMQMAEMASFWANNLYHNDPKEALLKGFFACVMPEYPALKVKKFIREACKK